MNTFTKPLQTFWRNEEGLTTVEYAIAGSLISATLVLAFTNLGSAVGAAIQGLITRITP